MNQQEVTGKPGELAVALCMNQHEVTGKLGELASLIDRAPGEISTINITTKIPTGVRMKYLPLMNLERNEIQANTLFRERTMMLQGTNAFTSEQQGWHKVATTKTIHCQLSAEKRQQ
jgi:hypothetical protein